MVHTPLSVVARLSLACTLLFGTLCLAAGDKDTPQDQQREQLSINVEEIAKPWTGDLDGMIERRIIRVLTVYSKTFYFLDKGIQRGATYDALRLFEKDLTKKLAKTKKKKGSRHLEVHVVFLPVSRGEILQALVAGKGDIAAANLTLTEDRRRLVDFPVPVYPDASELLVSGPASPAVASVEDLSGKEVFVRKSSSYYESLTSLNQRFEVENKPGVIINEAPEELEDEDLIEMTNAGLIPLTVVDKHIADFWKQIFPKVRVHEKIVLRDGGSIGWAIRKESPLLKTAVDDFVTRNRKGTAAGNSILKKYLKNAKYVKDAASKSERKKFLTLVKYFQKYGDKYDVDWLLMAAQGYQESGLNQNARSAVGAIGVMQVMPATGEDLRVGDISKTEPNIHAGVKYMRWMIDEYYGNEPMSKQDKALFALASYNAGAGRISKLRQEASRRGLDPNIWFHNVEILAAEKIGAETVTYVSNIFKYYIAYQLIMKAKAEKEKAARQMKGQGN